MVGLPVAVPRSEAEVEAADERGQCRSKVGLAAGETALVTPARPAAESGSSRDSGATGTGRAE
jgi:hypothetical protein